MSIPYLLPEILDYTIDFLHDQLETLKRCSLVSKSWVPRTRKHLFADIGFQTEEHLRSWKEAFPDPSTSPAHYAKTLFVECPQVVVAADAEPGGWIRGFSGVVNLRVGSHALSADRSFSLVPFHGLSPVLKSLHVIARSLRPSQIVNLILSFPLLEDLAMNTSFGTLTDDGNDSNRQLTATQPPSPPVFTGSLRLRVLGAMEPITRQLLSLPSGIHFRRLALMWFEETDSLATTALVEGCSHTLESLKISGFSRASI
jgi:hypothetical protein